MNSYEILIEKAKLGVDELMDYVDNDKSLVAIKTVYAEDSSISVDISTFDNCMGTDFLIGFDFDKDGNYLQNY